MAPITPIVFISSGAGALRTGKIVIVTIAPFVLLIASYIVAFIAAPSTARTGFQAEYQMFFSSTAVVLATVLVTLVVQASLFRSGGIKPAALLGVFYIVCGEVAATLSLSPGLDPTVAHHAFALTVSAGVGSLAAVAFIAVKILTEQSYRVSRASDGTATLEQSQAAPVPPTGPGAQAAPLASVPSREDAGIPAIELTPQAVKDLDELGTLSARTVVWLMEQRFADSDHMSAVSKRLLSGWNVVQLGRVRAIYRMLSKDELASKGGTGPVVVIERLISEREMASAVAKLDAATPSAG